MDPTTFQLPPAMSTGAPSYDSLYMFIFWFSVVFTVLITGLTLLFVRKYKRQKGVKPTPTDDLTKLEIVWTVVPVIAIVFMFHGSWKVYIQNVTAAEGATEIRVRAKKWSWEFEYPGGARAPGEVYLEVNKPYKLILSSEDVIHSFFVPEFRVKRDAVPGQYSFVTFTPNVTGDAQVFCTEYCGTSHSNMLAKVHVVTHEELEKFKETLGKRPAGLSPEQWGKDLFAKNGCTACHGDNGEGRTGPKLAGLFDRGTEATTAGAVTVDENYIRESILRPNAKIVAGYANVQMPPFVLQDEQLDAVIAYIKTLK